jgi:hypothetical protein
MFAGKGVVEEERCRPRCVVEEMSRKSGEDINLKKKREVARNQPSVPVSAHGER